MMYLHITANGGEDSPNFLDPDQKSGRLFIPNVEILVMSAKGKGCLLQSTFREHHFSDA